MCDEINEVDEVNKIKVEVQFHRQFFPKDNKPITNGDYGIVAWKVVNVIEGCPELHPHFQTITIKGTMCEIEKDETYTIIAKESPSDKGMQYELLYIGQPSDLSDVEDQRIFLSRILTDKQVQQMFNTFESPIDIIKNGDTRELTKIKGIGDVTAQRIIDKYELTKDYSKLYVELDGYGLTNAMIGKLLSRYSSPEVVISKIKENPYILATEVDGVGFLTADKLALENGLEWDNPNRVEAFVLHRLEEEAQNGNSYIRANDLMYNIEDVLGDVPKEYIGQAVNGLVEKKRVGLDEVTDGYKRVYLTRYKNLERKVSNELLRILNGENNFKSNNWEQKVRELEERQGWTHTIEQWEGIRTVLENQVVVITGGSGTGKSSVVRAMLEALTSSQSGYTFAQTALSGKASARLQEVTGEEGKTIHRLLEFNPFDGFVRNEFNQLEEDLIVLDEISLVGGHIFLNLIKAIKTGSKLILLGDDGQLPSIGCMNLAQDLINSNSIPTVTLTKIHRQAQKSGIITESIKMRNGEQSIERSFSGRSIRGELQDFEFDVSIDKEGIKERVVNHFKKWYNELKDIMDVQIIAPVKSRGECCVEKINNDIQEIYNPRSKVKREFKVVTNKKKDEGYILREKDKVIITKNNYKTVDTHGEDTPIFNGWIGILEEISDSYLAISFPMIKKTVLISSKQADVVKLGYANTVHSLQGSSAKVIIGALDYTTPPLMRTRELVYTLVTRAEEYCVLVAQNGAFREAVETSFVSEKNTFLKEMIDGEI